MSFNFVDDTLTVDPAQTSIPDGGFTQTNIPDAGDTSTPTEADFTKDQIDQMEGQAWESLQDPSETTTNNQFNV